MPLSWAEFRGPTASSCTPRCRSTDPPCCSTTTSRYNEGKSSTPIALGGTPVTIHLTVTDVEASFQQALDSGATVVAPLEDQFWGDRYGVVRDPFGHHWSLGQPVREVSMEEIAEAMKQGS